MREHAHSSLHREPPICTTSRSEGDGGRAGGCSSWYANELSCFDWLAFISRTRLLHAPAARLRESGPDREGREQNQPASVSRLGMTGAAQPHICAGEAKAEAQVRVRSRVPLSKVNRSRSLSTTTAAVLFAGAFWHHRERQGAADRQSDGFASGSSAAQRRVTSQTPGAACLLLPR